MQNEELEDSKVFCEIVNYRYDYCIVDICVRCV